MNLRQIFQHAKKATLPKGWLYLPADTEWTLDTEGVFILDEDFIDGEDVPLIAQQLNLVEALSDDLIEDTVLHADRLAGESNDSARLEVFQYYWRYDSFPETLNAPEPPPLQTIIAQRDRTFYESLGAERPNTQCQEASCQRGTIQFSAFCRVHHFEQIKRKPCPFDD